MKKILGLLPLFFTIASFGQTVTEEGTPLQEVVIRENRLHSSLVDQNRNIRIITREQIDKLPVRSINEVLSYIAGVDLRQRGPGGIQADVSIDGGTFDQTLVLINGIRMTDPQTGHNMMNLPITLDVVDHIEVLKGPAARIYGVNALTGAINFVTRLPKQNELRLTGYGGGSFEKDTATHDTYYNWGARIAGAYVTEKANQLWAFSHDKGNGIRYNTAFDNSKAFYQGRFMTRGNDYLDLTAGYVFNDYGANGFFAAPGDKNSGETVRNVLASVGYQAQLTKNWTSRPRVNYRFAQDDYRYVKEPLSGRNLHKNNILNAEWNNTVQTRAGDIGFGLEYRTEIIRSSKLGSHNRSNYGIVGEYRFANLGRLSLTAGGYLNHNNEFGWQFFPGVDAGYKLTERLKWFANVGTGQRVPTYTDWYYSDPSTLANPNLKDEKARYIESGFKYNYWNLNITGSYFYRKINNLIDWVRQTAADKYQSENFAANMQGITAALDYKWENRNGNYFKNNLFGLSYTNLQPDIRRPAPYDSYQSKYAISALRNQLAMTASSDVIRSLNVSLAGRYQQRISYKDYWLLDARLSYTVARKCRIYVDGTNISNVNYAEIGGSPMPGRWYTAGVNLVL